MPRLQRNVLLKHKFKYQAIPINLMNIEINLERQQCELMGAFGVTVQIILGLLSFSILLRKIMYQLAQQKQISFNFNSQIAQLEHEEKLAHLVYGHFKISYWLCLYTFDKCDHFQLFNLYSSSLKLVGYSLQLVAILEFPFYSTLIHFFEIKLRYLVNYLQDFILGNSMNFFVVYMIKKFNDKYRIPALQFGQYYSEQTIEDYYPQLLAWLILISINKIILMSNIFMFSKFFHEVGDSLLRNLKNYPKTQLILVVVVIPLILNTISYWTTDSFLRSKDDNEKLSYLPYEKILHQKDQEGEEEKQETKLNSNQDLFNQEYCDELNSTQEIYSEDNLKYQQI
ncbi:hypothetical protein ABPG72_009599 [Tetrahymena utriculariae]